MRNEIWPSNMKVLLEIMSAYIYETNITTISIFGKVMTGVRLSCDPEVLNIPIDAEQCKYEANVEF
jgi:hypothetical protein